jgi:hypothetical protein
MTIRLYLLLLFFLALLGSHNGFAQSKSWTGATSSIWNIDSNWNPSGVPTSSDNVYINGGTNTVTISANAVVRSIQIRDNRTLTISSGFTLNIVGDGSIFAYLDIYENSTVINNGTVALQTTSGGSVGGFFGVRPSSTFTNNGTLIINTTNNRAVEMGNPAGASIITGNATLTNNSCAKILELLWVVN